MLSKNQLIGLATFIILGEILSGVVYFLTNKNFFIYALITSVTLYFLVGKIIRSIDKQNNETF